MKAGIGLVIYIAATMALLVLLLETRADAMFTGEIFIALFIGILLFGWANAMRETQKLVKEKPDQSETPATH
jgi:hypothetical protein